jgi:hypothetical protein
MPVWADRLAYFLAGCGCGWAGLFVYATLTYDRRNPRR